MTKEDEAYQKGRRSGMASANAKKRKKKTTKRKVAIGGLSIAATFAAVAAMTGGQIAKHPVTDSIRDAIKPVMLKIGLPANNRIVVALSILIASQGLKRVLNEMRLNPELFRIGGRLFKAV